MGKISGTVCRYFLFVFTFRKRLATPFQTFKHEHNQWRHTRRGRRAL